MTILITEIEDEKLYAQVLELLAPGMFDGRVHTIHEVPEEDVRFIRADGNANWRRSDAG